MDALGGLVLDQATLVLRDEDPNEDDVPGAKGHNVLMSHTRYCRARQRRGQDEASLSPRWGT